MDAHFEVILERVTALTNISNTTVWYEIPPNLSRKKQQLIVLINDKNDVGAIKLTYTDNLPTLEGYILDKPTYENLLHFEYDMSKIIDDPTCNIHKHEPGHIIGVITNTNK